VQSVNDSIEVSKFHFKFVVPPENAGERLDRFLASQLPELSRTRLQSLIEEGRIQVDGMPARRSDHIAQGQTLIVDIPAPAPAGVEAEEIPLDILYQDEDLAVVNKPAGMIVHPGAGADTGTLVAALLHRFGGIHGLSNVGGPLRPGIVHRLDKETSGVLIVALNDAAHRKLVEEFRERQIGKIYIALLHGKVKGEAGTIDLPVARDLHRRSRMTARRREGREARTDWRVRLRLGAFTLVEANLHTGRTHQIRVHFSALGSPVVGDTVYGAPRVELVAGASLPPLNRNFLHAARVAFDHPRTGKRIEIRAPLPATLVSYLANLGVALKTDAALIDVALQPYL
jgi:23S rRNA pseudouridine1911/1915/1917 synthase